mgnify:CR=1 FL=1
MARDLTPEEQEAERQARAAVDPAAIQLDVIRAVASGHMQSLGPELSLFLARVIVDSLAEMKLPGGVPARVLGTVAIARAGSEAMQATIARRHAVRVAPTAPSGELPKP